MGALVSPTDLQPSVEINLEELSTIACIRTFSGRPFSKWKNEKAHAQRIMLGAVRGTSLDSVVTETSASAVLFSQRIEMLVEAGWNVGGVNRIVTSCIHPYFRSSFEMEASSTQGGMSWKEDLFCVLKKSRDDRHCDRYPRNIGRDDSICFSYGFVLPRA